MRLILTKLPMARHFYFLLLCFALVSLVHSDCLENQARYDKTFEKMFPVCDEECTKKRRIHEADFAELFPQCKASKDSKQYGSLPSTTPHKNLVTGLTKIDSHHVSASTINKTKIQSCAEKRRIYDDEKIKRIASVTERTIYSDFNTNGLREICLKSA